MKVIHLLRKPCSESTVAANVLRWGTGALNIDACRVGFVSEADEAESKTKNQHADFGSAPLTGNVTYGDYSMVPPKNYNPPSGGRWPANLVLQHLDGCVQDGAKKVGGNRTDTRPEGDGGRGDKTQWRFRPTEATRRGYSDPDGTETVAAWVCALGCPVAGIDQQSGDLPVSRGGGNGYACSIFGTNTSSNREKGVVGFGDSGGASRFFKQVKA